MAIKILHIIKSLGRGGAETLLPETLRLHDRVKFNFHYIYFLPWKDQLVNALSSQGSIVKCFSSGNNLVLLLQARKVARYVKENEIQMIHAHLPWAGILARLVGKLSGVPVLYTEHNKQERYHLGTRLANLATLNWLTGIIAVSEDVKQSILAHKKNISVPVTTLLNGVNDRTFLREGFDGNVIRQRLGIPADAKVIGTVAVFRAQKRLDVWLEIAKQISGKHENVHFILVGDGPLKNALQEKVRELKLEHNVHLVGLQSEVRPYLAALNIYMMTSLFEGLPIALLEAMAFELPVITTDAGGITEVVRHNIDGLVCPTESPMILAEYASLLLADRNKCREFGLSSRHRITENFSLSVMVEKLEKLYQKTLKY